MIHLFALNSLVVMIAVTVHYEFLSNLAKLMPKLNIAPRLRILLGVIGALIAHSIEVWIFAVTYFWMNGKDGWGYLEGNFDGSFWDCVYFSFTTYTTLGFGDIAPRGDLRYLTGIESLTGLVLVTWTASFLFIEMQHYWNSRPSNNE